MESLIITIVQSDLIWENVDKNKDAFSKKIDSISEKTDLIILPEMFTTGFSMLSEHLAETMDGPSVQWMLNKAAEKKCVICGSLIIEENGRFYNRIIWAKPDNTYETYDKRHLFRMAGEDKYYSAGDKKLILEIKGWRICPLICYDLRFPVWSRNKNEFDLLIYIASWPEVRRTVWNVLLQARAIENQVYVAGVNRIGSDINNIIYSGDSAVYSPKGNLISKTKAFEESIETIVISGDELEDFRKKFPVAMDADNFDIHL